MKAPLKPIHSSDRLFLNLMHFTLAAFAAAWLVVGSALADVGASTGAQSDFSVDFSTEAESSASENYSVVEDEWSNESGIENRISANYFGIFYGPSVAQPNSSFQPTTEGAEDYDRPLEAKNWVGLAYHFNEDISLGPTFHFTNESLQGRGFVVQDPFIRFTHASIWSNDDLNLFGDLRLHFPVSTASKQADQRFAIQFREVLGWAIPNSRIELGIANSQWFRSFGSYGKGDDLTLYVGPYAMVQMSPTVAFTVLYEAQASHRFGQDAFELNNDGTDLEPGISWDITPSINLNPYLNLYPSSFSWKSTSIGANLSVVMF